MRSGAEIWFRPPIHRAARRSLVTRARPNALYWEFEEIGPQATWLFRRRPTLLEVPAFFWNSVSMHLDDGIKYLNIDGFPAAVDREPPPSYSMRERAQRLMGPQA